MRMERTRALPLVGALVLVPSLLAGQAITASRHDFSTGSGLSPYNKAAGKCISCHVAHNGSTIAPLWNHTTNSTGYTMYSSATINGTQQAAPALVSLACLGCHDGVIAVDAYGGNTPLQKAGGGDSLLVGLNVPAAVMGKNLTNDHPISIQYGQPPADFNAAVSGLVGSLPLYGPSTTKDQVECGSCHNPHQPNYTGAVPADTGKFLRQAQSTICTACHIK